MFSSLRVRLILLVLLALLPAVGLMLYMVSEQRRQAVNASNEAALGLARHAAEEQKDLIRDTHELLAGLAQLPSVREHRSRECSSLFASILKGSPRYVSLGAARPNGDLFCSGLLTPPGAVNLADRPYFQRALQTRAFTVSEYLVSRGAIAGKPTIALAFPAVDGSGIVQVVVVAGLDLGWLVRLAGQARLPRGSTVSVLDRNGVVLARHPDPEKWVGKSVADNPLVRTVLARREGAAEGPGMDGVRRLYAFAPVHGTPEAVHAYVTVGIPKEIALAGAKRVLAWGLLGLGLVFALALVAARLFAGRFILRPVDLLVGATRRLGAGDLSARTGLPYEKGELGQLARAFDDMARSLQARQEEARRAEEELQRQREITRQQEKLALMGELLAGVAHELNSPLAVVVGRATLLSQTVGGGPLAAQVAKIAEAGARCARIVRNFLALARQRLPERQAVELNLVVREALELLAYPLRTDNVEVRLELATDLPVIGADPHQLHQVLVNLISNAHHAMRESRPPRRLTLTTRYVPAQGRVTLEVADTGPGIPPAVQARLFEPFFTTKPPGQGTGLGLSICRGIIEGHRGTIRVESPPGKGAIVRIELPAVAPPAAVPEAPAAEALPLTGGRAILVVDDEPEVASMLAEALSLDGHKVETAVNGLIALDKLAAGTYEVILSDIKMPELDGPGLYREVARRYPELLSRFIFFTGDALSPETRKFLEETTAPTLGKPFALEEVQRALQRIP